MDYPCRPGRLQSTLPGLCNQFTFPVVVQEGAAHALPTGFDASRGAPITTWCRQMESALLSGGQAPPMRAGASDVLGCWNPPTSLAEVDAECVSAAGDVLAHYLAWERRIAAERAELLLSDAVGLDTITRPDDDLAGFFPTLFVAFVVASRVPGPALAAIAEEIRAIAFQKDPRSLER